MLRYALVTWGLSIFLGAANQALGQGQMALASQPNKLAVALGSVFGQVFVHEGGHAIAALSVGYRVEAFKPFPHICDGKFVAGCVEMGDAFGPGLVPGVGKKGKQVIISAMGSTFSVLGAALTLPLLPTVRNTTNRLLLDQMVTLQIADWPFYCLADLLGFQGDWYQVSRLTGISLWVLLPLSMIEFIAMNRYHHHYLEEAKSRYPDDYADPEAALATPGLTLLRIGF